MFKIKGYKYRFSLKEHLGPLSFREGIILQIEDSDGTLGYGEIAPLPGFSTETLDQALAQVKEAIKLEDPSSLGLFPSVAFGLESCFLSLMANRHHSSINRIITPNAPQNLPVNKLLYGDSRKILDAVRSGLSDGYSCFKVKIGDQAPILDIRLLEAISTLLPTSASLRVDLNRKWSLNTALEYASDLSSFPVEYYEEPVAQPKDLITLYEESGLSIAIDETFQAAQNLPLSGMPYISAILIKPTLIGGLNHCLELAQNALYAHKKVVFTSSFESSLGCYVIAHLASAVCANTHHGLTTFEFFNEDIFPVPLVIHDGQLSLSHNFNTLNLDALECVLL